MILELILIAIKLFQMFQNTNYLEHSTFEVQISSTRANDGLHTQDSVRFRVLRITLAIKSCAQRHEAVVIGRMQKVLYASSGEISLKL